MVLQPQGALELYTLADQTTPAIKLDPGNTGAPSIEINGSPVLTVAAANALYLTPSAATAKYVGIAPGRAHSIVGPGATVGGEFSISLGYGATTSVPGATPMRTIAIGAGSKAIAPMATAIGFSAEATGESSTSESSLAIGDRAKAQSHHAVAVGPFGHASGYASVAMGSQAVARATSSVALGYQAVAGAGTGGEYCNVALGPHAYSKGIGSVAVGYGAVAEGQASTAAGYFLHAKGHHQTVVGSFNQPIGNPEALSFNPDGSDIVFVVGNGTGHEALSNALTIRQDAGTAIGTGVVSKAAAQVVVGKFNDVRTDDGATDHTTGLFVVGAGSSETNRKNGLRVVEKNGTTLVLIPPGGDLSMGEFTNGERP
jgi:hypothetical protein